MKYYISKYFGTSKTEPKSIDDYVRLCTQSETIQEFAKKDVALDTFKSFYNDCENFRYSSYKEFNCYYYELLEETSEGEVNPLCISENV